MRRDAAFRLGYFPSQPQTLLGQLEWGLRARTSGLSGTWRVLKLLMIIVPRSLAGLRWGHLQALVEDGVLTVSMVWVCVSPLRLRKSICFSSFGNKLLCLHSPSRNFWELQLNESSKQNSLLSFQFPLTPVWEGNGISVLVSDGSCSRCCFGDRTPT